MIFAEFQVDLKNGEFTIELDRPCQCFVGLAEFHLPSINDPDLPDNVVELSCDQIDSTFFNPERLLKRLVFEQVGDGYYNHYEAKNIQFKPIDSQDKYLTFKLKRTSKSHELAFELMSKAYITLAFKPFGTDNPRWIRGTI